MKTITVGFSHSNNLFSKLIMWATKSNISHTYIKLGDGIIYQASGLSVNEQTDEDFLTYETVIEEMQVQVSDDQFAAGEKFRVASLGKPYSIKEVLGFVWVMFMKCFGKEVANPLKDGGSAYVCSKLVCNYIGIDDSLENLTPEDVHDILVCNKSV